MVDRVKASCDCALCRAHDRAAQTVADRDAATAAKERKLGDAPPGYDYGVPPLGQGVECATPGGCPECRMGRAMENTVTDYAKGARAAREAKPTGVKVTVGITPGWLRSADYDEFAEHVRVEVPRAMPGAGKVRVQMDPAVEDGRCLVAFDNAALDDLGVIPVVERVIFRARAIATEVAAARAR